MNESPFTTQKSIKLREDEFSIQATAPHSKHFFVRVIKPINNNTNFIISDFIIKDDDDFKSSVHALYLIFERLELTASHELRFTNIYPLFYMDGNKSEVVRIHDKIFEAVTQFASKRGFRVHQSQLDAKHDQFDTIIKVGQ